MTRLLRLLYSDYKSDLGCYYRLKSKRKVFKRDFNVFQYVLRNHKNISHEKYITVFFLWNYGILINPQLSVKVIH